MDMGCCNSEFHALYDRQTTEHSTARLATLIKYIYIYVCVCVCVCVRVRAQNFNAFL